MEQIIQHIDRYFQHAKRTRLNTFTSASVLSNNASKAITALNELLENPEYAGYIPFLEEVMDQCINLWRLKKSRHKSGLI